MTVGAAIVTAWGAIKVDTLTINLAVVRGNEDTFNVTPHLVSHGQVKDAKGARTKSVFNVNRCKSKSKSKKEEPLTFHVTLICH